MIRGDLSNIVSLGGGGTAGLEKTNFNMQTSNDFFFFYHFINDSFLSSAAAGDNTYRTHFSIDSVSRVSSLCLSLHYDDYVIGSGNSGCFMNNLSQLLI